MKRRLALALSCAMLIECLALPAFAEEQQTGEKAPLTGAVKGGTVEDALTAGLSDILFETLLDGAGIQYTDRDESEGIPVSFDRIQPIMKKNNPNIRAMYLTLENLEKQNTDELEDALGELKSLRDKIEGSLNKLQRLGGSMGSIGGGMAGPGDGGAGDGGMGDLAQSIGQIMQIQGTLIEGVAVSLGANLAMVEMQIATLESQIKSVEMNLEKNKNTLNDGINQMYKGAETLYVAILMMEAALPAVDEGLAAMDRAVALYEKQYELGMVSRLDMEDMQYQRTTIESQREDLLFQIDSNKVTLLNLLGMPLNVDIVLEDVETPKEAAVSQVSFERNVTEATKRNVTVRNAKVDMDYNEDEDQEETYELYYEAAQRDFAASFKNVCMTVEDKARLLDTAKAALEHEEKLFAVTEKKYELGMISHEEYLTGESSVHSAEGEVRRAELDLFTAYRNYLWGLEGLV